MEIKKHYKADIEKKKIIFLQIGFIISISIILIAMEWGTAVTGTIPDTSLVGVEMIVEMQYISRVEKLTPPIPKPKDIENLEIVDNNIPLENEYEVTDTEIFETTKIDISDLIEEEDEEPAIVIFAEKMPEFPGGKKTLLKFIARNIKYPVLAKENNIQGRVFVRFLVTHKGNIKQATVLRSVHSTLDKEALRIVKSFPRWKAGIQNGKPVNVWLTLPITFQLN